MKINPGGRDRRPAQRHEAHHPKPHKKAKAKAKAKARKPKRVIAPGPVRRLIQPAITGTPQTTSVNYGQAAGPYQSGPSVTGTGYPGSTGDMTGTAGQNGIGQVYSDAVYGTGQSYAPEYVYAPMPQEQAVHSAIASPGGGTGGTG